MFTNPCSPTPCGLNSECRVVNGQAVCSCIRGYLGSPPTCRPECIVSTDCPQNEACTNQRCTNPCPGSCGVGAQCNVVNHNPICVCPLRYTGDPFVRCTPFRKCPFSQGFSYEEDAPVELSCVPRQKFLNSRRAASSKPLPAIALRSEFSVPSD